MDAIALLFKAFAVCAPTFAWVGLGIAGRRLGILPLPLVERLARFSFVWGLPIVLFFGAARVDYGTLNDAQYLWAGIVATVVVLSGALAYGWWRGMEKGQLGIFAQCAYRSNLGIMGLALAIAAYGERGLVLASLPVAVMTVFYNIIAVVLLGFTLGGTTSPVMALKGIARNPLIIGISAGVIWSLLGLPLAPLEPLPALASAGFIPLALVAVGGGMNLMALRSSGAITWEAAAWRLCLGPAIGTAVALVLGVSGDALGVLFLLLASPVAAASYVMVVAARGDGALAANLVVVTTLLSLFSVPLGFFMLSLFGLIG